MWLPIKKARHVTCLLPADLTFWVFWWCHRLFCLSLQNLWSIRVIHARTNWSLSSISHPDWSVVWQTGATGDAIFSNTGHWGMICGRRKGDLFLLPMVTWLVNPITFDPLFICKQFVCLLHAIAKGNPQTSSAILGKFARMARQWGRGSGRI